jgi:branched-chain amino acid transport system permease protein
MSALLEAAWAKARARAWYLAFAAILLLVPLATSGWSQRQFVLDLGGQVAVFTVVLLGLSLLYGWTGQIALGHSAFVGLGAYTTAIIDRTAGVGFQGGGLGLALEELGAVVAVCAAAGLLIGLPAVRISGLQLVIITFGAGQIFLWFLATYSSFTGGDQGLTVAPLSFSNLSTISVSTRYVAAMIVALLLTLVVGQLRDAPIGHAMRSIRHSTLAAQSVGVNIARTKLLAFVLSGVLAGVGGWLYAHELSAVAPGYFDTFASIFLLAAVLIGGNGTLAGAWLGAAYLILVPEGVQKLGQGGNFYTTVSGLFLIAVVLFAPHGLSDLARRVGSAVAGPLRRARTTSRPVEAKGYATRMERVQTRAAPSSLAVKDIGVQLGGVRVLSDVSIALDATVINGIIGPNGAGKTTLLNVVTGLVTPSQGTIELNGERIGDLHARERAARGIGRTFQTPRLLESESVETNILLGRFRFRQATILGQALSSPAHRRYARRDAEAVRSIAGQLGFGPRDLGRRVSSLPAGTRRLVEVGRVLAMEPSVILLDEPIAGLDVEERQAMAAVLGDYQRSSSTLIVVIEHNVDWVRAVCQRLFVLDAGRLLAVGPPSEVLGLASVREAYFGLSDRPAPAVVN